MSYTINLTQSQYDSQVEIQRLISRLETDGIFDTRIIENLSQIAMKGGFEEDIILELFNIIFDKSPSTSISLRRKEFIIDNVLALKEPISITLFWQIISNIGTNEIYYKGQLRFETMKVPTSLQIQILNWLIDNFEYFRVALIQSGNLVLSLLIKTLSYEFLRVQISRLIVLLLQENIEPVRTYFNRDTYHQITLLKHWHIQWVVDLYEKFPLDLYLQELLAFFRVVDPTIDYIAYTHDGFQTLNRLKSNERHLFADFMDRQEAAEEEEEDDREFNTDVMLANKRRKKMLRRSRDDVYGANKSLLLLDDIYNINPYSLFRLPKQQVNKVLPLVFQYGNTNLITRLDSFVRISLSDQLSSKSEYEDFIKQISYILHTGGGTIEFPLVTDFVLQRSVTKREFLETLPFRYGLLKYLKQIDISDLSNTIVQDITKLLDIKHQVTEEISTEFLKSLIDYFDYNPLDELDSGDDINLILSMIYKYIQSCEAAHKNQMIRLMTEFIQSLDSPVLKKLDDRNILIPQSLVYSLLLDGDPLSLSDICKHILFCKSHKFKLQQLKSIQNTFTMDTVNFLWREKFLTYDEIPSSANKAFYLHPEFINKVGSLHMFDHDFFTTATLGGLFTNPALVYIVTNIVWKLEDNADMINTRHEGPITRQSIRRLKDNEGVTWLDYDFDGLRVKVLQKLDEFGFDGICEFLFSSLKSLEGKRIRRIGED